MRAKAGGKSEHQSASADYGESLTATGSNGTWIGYTVRVLPSPGSPRKGIEECNRNIPPDTVLIPYQVRVKSCGKSARLSPVTASAGKPSPVQDRIGLGSQGPEAGRSLEVGSNVDPREMVIITCFVRS